MLQNRAIPRTDPFSWTAAGDPWVAHEWGSDVVLALVDRSLGPLALLVLVGLSVGLTLAIVIRTLRRLDVDAWAQILAGAGLVATSSVAWSVRPHVFSLPLLALVVDTLVAYRAGEADRRVWTLVPLVCVWANLHGVFVAGVAVIWLFCCGLWLHDRPRAMRLLPVAAAATLAGALNPNGFALYLHPLHVARVSTQIEEWQPTLLWDGPGLAFAALAVVTPYVLIARRIRVEATFWIPALATALAGFVAVKNIWMAGVVVAPVAGRALSDLLPPPGPRVGVREGRRLFVLTAFSVGLLALVTLVPLASMDQADLRAEHAFPVAAVEELSERPDGRVLNFYDWGGYLIWKLPGRAVSIDGRNDMYGEVTAEQFAVEELKPGWRDYLEDKDVQYALFPPTSALVEALRLLRDEWSVIHEDDMAVLLQRRRAD